MNKKILFIQNNFIFQGAEDALKTEGLEIFNATDGEAGLALIKKEGPALVLLDLVLPKKDGLEVVKEMRADKELTDTPVIFLINMEEISEVEKFLRLGKVTYFLKGKNGEAENLINKIKNYV